MIRSEMSLLQRIQDWTQSKNPNVICGVGDDCSVVSLTDQLWQLTSTDCLIEGVHFDRSYYSAFDIGHKTIAVNLSDIAAMGGTPQNCFITLGLSDEVDESWVEEFYQGFKSVAQPYHVDILGGDLSRAKERIFINVTIVGNVSSHGCKLRRGATAGDILYLTGPVGSSALGLKLLQKDPNHESVFASSHRRPRACVEEGQWLSHKQEVTSMIDVSDGLLIDLKRMAEASQCGALIHLQQIPHESEMKLLCDAWNMDWTQLVLAGGEDYQLLLTVQSASAEKFEQQAHQQGFSFQRIGTMTDQVGCVEVLDADGHTLRTDNIGFDHFA